MNCVTCNGDGRPGGCPDCGQIAYLSSVNIREAKELDFRIPSYYINNRWETGKIVGSTNLATKGVLDLLDRLVRQTYEGKQINSSFIIMLPFAHGKKTGMYSIIQNYLNSGYTVAPVVDIVNLALMQHNFSLRRPGAVEEWQRLIHSDLVCVYGVDFHARYQTLQLFHSLCSIRSLQNRPTLLFTECGMADLNSMKFTERYDVANNLKDIGCRLANPFIFDGVTPEKSRR